jgi:hypothetical protein
MTTNPKQAGVPKIEANQMSRAGNYESIATTDKYGPGNYPQMPQPKIGHEY